MQSEASKVVEAGAQGQKLIITRTAFMRYKGQGHEIEAGIPEDNLDRKAIQNLVGIFEDEYRRLFGRVVPGMKIEVMNWSVRVSTQTEKKARQVKNEALKPAKPSHSRQLFLGQTGQQVTAICYQRDALKTGDTLSGPALIIEPQQPLMSPMLSRLLSIALTISS